MEIQQLEYFVAVCDEGSFTAAAKACFTSRQNLTRSVKRLESEMGAQLFSRKGGKATPTYAGKQALPHARTIVYESRFLQGAFSQSGADAPLRVVLATNTSTFLPRGFYSNALFDGVEASEHLPSECHARVLASEADVAIVMSARKKFDGCSCVVLHEEPIYLLVGEQSPLSKKRRVTLSDLVGYEVCVLPDKDFVYGGLIDAYRELGIGEQALRTIGNIGLVKSALRSRGAVAIVPADFDPSGLAGITSVPLADRDALLATSCLYRKKSQQAPAIVRFIANAKELWS